VPGSEAAVALAQVNFVTVRRAEMDSAGGAWTIPAPPLLPLAPAAPRALAAAAVPAELRTEWILEEPGRRLAVSVWSDGSAVLDEDGNVRRFADLGALKAAAPAAAARFGDRLR
jgi:hypothetical protein